MKRNAYTLQAILLTGIFGGMSIVSANDFLTLFVSIELLSFSACFLVASSKGCRSKEAAFKYLLTSAVSTGVFLFGVSYLYGITGTINLSEIYEFSVNQSPSVMYSVFSIFIILGIISKLAVLPFANWVIDVYKGTETSILAFLSTIPKLAIFGIVCRLLVFPLGGSFELTLVLIVICILTAFWANTFAVRENNVKAVFACSASANSSYALLAACLVSVQNLSAVIFYLLCYMFMNIGVFSFLNVFGDENSMKADNFRGLFYSNQGLTCAYAVSVLALAGIPITSGFVSKIYLFAAIAGSGLIFVPILLILLVLTVIALFYYLKILSPLFNNSNNPALRLNPAFSQKFVLIAAAIITVLLGIFPEKIIELCKFAAYNI